MSQLNVGGVVFYIDAILTNLDRTIDKGKQKIDGLRQYAERPINIGGGGFFGGGGVGGGGSRGTSGNVTHGQWDLDGGTGTMSQRYGYQSQRATHSYAQSDMHAELVAARSRGVMADQQAAYDDMDRIAKEAAREVRTRPGGVRGSRRYYSAGGDDYAGQGYGRGGRRPAESRDATLESMVNDAAQNIADSHDRHDRNTRDWYYRQARGRTVDTGGLRSDINTGDIYGNSPRMGNFETQDIGGLRSNIGTGEITGDPKAHLEQKTNFLTRKIQVRNLLRYTLGGIIADTLALELGNEENYKKGMALAGMDQHGQAAAELGRFKGGVGAIPVLGPALQGLFSPFTQPIETSLEMDENRSAMQNRMFGTGLEGAAIRGSSRILSYGRNRYGRQNAITAEEIRKAKVDRQIKSQQLSAEFDKNNPDFDNSPDSDETTLHMGYRKQQRGYMSDDSPYAHNPLYHWTFDSPADGTDGFEKFKEKARSDYERGRADGRRVYLATNMKGMADDATLAAEKQRQDQLDFAEDYTVQSGEVQSKLLAANKRPIAGQLTQLSANAKASFNRYTADAKSPQGMLTELNNQFSNFADAQQIYQDARDKQLFGQSIAFNPFNESADKFQTKDTESLDQKMSQALDTMARIAQYIFSIQSGSLR